MCSPNRFQAVITVNKKEKLVNLAPSGCFTNAASRTDTLLERVRTSCRRRTTVASTTLQETAEMERWYSLPKYFVRGHEQDVFSEHGYA